MYSRPVRFQIFECIGYYCWLLYVLTDIFFVFFKSVNFWHVTVLKFWFPEWLRGTVTKQKSHSWRTQRRDLSKRIIVNNSNLCSQKSENNDDMKYIYFIYLQVSQSSVHWYMFRTLRCVLIFSVRLSAFLWCA